MPPPLPSVITSQFTPAVPVIAVMSTAIRPLFSRFKAAALRLPTVLVALPALSCPLTVVVPLEPVPYRNAPEATVTAEDTLVPFWMRMPPETVVLPLRVLAPVRVSVPARFVSAPVPLSTALTVWASVR